MEAILSDSGGEGMIDSESESVEIDGYDSSFVDDATQKPLNDTDEQAYYLKLRAEHWEGEPPILGFTSSREQN